MRILFSFVGGRGHLEPLLPIAEAAAARGHAVAFLCGPKAVSAVEAAGFEALAGTAAGAAAEGAPPAGPAERLPLRAVDRAREERDLRDRFARRAAASRAQQALAVCASWKPDLVVCDETDFGPMIAAERLGLPHATVGVIAPGSFVRPDVVAEALDAVRGAHGLAPDPALEMPGRYLVLSTAPPRYRDPADPLPPTAHTFRPPVPAPAAESPPAWASALPGEPAVYFTLGTVFNLESGDLFARVLAGLRELPINLLATTGNDVDPAELGPQPGNVRVERYVPQSSVLPWCSLVVSHGGSGSVVCALAHGLPQVLIPLGADQPWNGDRCAALGLARVLDAAVATPQEVRGAVSATLADPSYRQNAERLRDEMAGLPAVAEAVPLLERLAVERRPLPRA